jgi:hypothetical protein
MPSPEAQLEGRDYGDRVWVDPDGTRWRYPDFDEHAASVVASTLGLSLPAFDAVLATGNMNLFEQAEVAGWRASLIEAVREEQKREARAWITLMRWYLLSTGSQRRLVARLRDQDAARRKGGERTRRLPPDAVLLKAFDQAVAQAGSGRGSVTKAHQALAKQYSVTVEAVRRRVERARRAAQQQGALAELAAGGPSRAAPPRPAVKTGKR